MECDPKHCPLAELTTTTMTSLNSRKVELLEFLFKQRLLLFNTRRDHEWKVFFGVMSILGAVDYALVTREEVRAIAGIQYWWFASVLVLLVASGCFQYGVQSRNHADRWAMDDVSREIREEINIHDAKRRDHIGVGVDCSAVQKTYPSIWHITYLWAFYCEMLVLLVACALSAAIPFVVPIHSPKTSQDAPEKQAAAFVPPATPLPPQGPDGQGGVK
jgi:hypothetical protein